MTIKSRKTAQPVKQVRKPFLTGSPTDERTAKSALVFFGTLLITAFMTFLVCSAITMDIPVLRIILNLVVETMVLFIFYNSAIAKGSEAVARGEILYQRQEKGQTFAASEKAVCFHPLKGYVTGFLGTVPFLVCAVILACLAQRQTTGAGTLPSWMNGYVQREEIGEALVAYTTAEGFRAVDILRIFIRIVIMPFVSMAGAENRDAMLLAERLSPLIVLLPAAAYGTGYLQGRKERTMIHTGIAQSRKNRARKEKRERKARMNRPKAPQQLN